MQLFASRVGHWPLALALVALGACADDERPTTGPSTPIKPNLAVGDVITVTNTLGNGAFGSLMWAVYLAANGGETIRFDPSIAGDTIFMENTLVVPKYVTIEGPADKGITISGRQAVRVMDIRQGATLRNLNIKNGYHPTMAAGILSYGPLRLENTSVFRNRSDGDMAGIFVGTEATLVNSTVTLNESPAGVAGISYPYNGKLALINSTVAMNYPGRGLMPHGAIITGPQVTLSNSIVADNGNLVNKLNCYDAVGFIYVGRNMSNDPSCGSSAQLIVANPLLSHPQFDGGPTATAPLHYNSPAINAGLNCAVTVDQRYVPRDQACDIGAYEFDRFNVVTITIDPKADINPYESAAMLTGTVSCTYADATPRTLRVELLQQQKGGKNPTWLQATQNIFFYCTTTPSPWNSALTPNGTTFVGGSALAKVQTTGTPTWYKPAATSSPVRLTVLRR